RGRGPTFGRNHHAAEPDALHVVAGRKPQASQGSTELVGHLPYSVQLQTMARLSSWALICLSAFAVAQQPSASKHLLIELPPGVPSESVNIEYALEGSFGSHGNYARPKPNEVVYTISVPQE